MCVRIYIHKCWMILAYTTFRKASNTAIMCHAHHHPCWVVMLAIVLGVFGLGRHLEYGQ
jgi:hypothetical protein